MRVEKRLQLGGATQHPLGFRGTGVAVLDAILETFASFTN